MKALLILVLVLMIRYNGHAQNSFPTNIYMLNVGAFGHSITIQTTNISNPIKIKQGHWAIIRLSQGDSLGLLMGNKPYFIHFEKGRNYYFIASSDYTPATVVSEKSERDFLLSVHVNTADKPDEYVLDK
jgi:hypothetical protein